MHPSNNRLVEQEASQTAMGTAFSRAVSAIEIGGVHGPDNLAEIFMSPEMAIILKDSNMRQEVKETIPKGMYEYLIARTVSFDHIVETALKENCPQIVFLGAGYDTRVFRFKDLIENTQIFELDIHTTQKRKKECLHQANISIPDQLVFVPIDFNTESLEDALLNAGLDRNKETLFIWEGVTYYLPPEAVDTTLNFIKSNSASGSTIAFDYVILSQRILEAYGVKELIEYMRSEHPGEPTHFILEEGKIESFLSQRGFEIVSHHTSEDLEKNILLTDDGSFLGRATGFFCIVHASVI